MYISYASRLPLSKCCSDDNWACWFKQHCSRCAYILQSLLYYLCFQKTCCECRFARQKSSRADVARGRSWRRAPFTFVTLASGDVSVPLGAFSDTVVYRTVRIHTSLLQQPPCDYRMHRANSPSELCHTRLCCYAASYRIDAAYCYTCRAVRGGLSVCLSVRWTHWRALQKRLNRTRCRLACRAVGQKNHVHMQWVNKNKTLNSCLYFPK